MRLSAVIIALLVAQASAQPTGDPTPPGPVEPAAPESTGAPSPSDGSGTAQAPAGSESSTSSPYDVGVSRPYFLLDDQMWPRGFSFEDLRELPDCGEEGVFPTPGALIQCRPMTYPARPAWSLAVDWTTGATFGKVPTTGGAQGGGLDLHFALGRMLQLGARYELLGIQVPRRAGIGLRDELSHHLFGSMRLRVWTDEVGRNAWTVGVGGGLAIRGDELGGVAPIVRASLAREVGIFYHQHASLGAIELAYERTLSEPSLAAILASLRAGFEINVIRPNNTGTPRPASSHVSSFYVLASAWLGIGMSVGVSLAPQLQLQLAGDYLSNVRDDTPTFRGFDGAQWSVRGGLRVQPSQLYVLGQGGVSWYAQDPSGVLHKVVHGEIGATVGGGLVDLGAWLRWDLDDTFDSAGFVLRFLIGDGKWGARTPNLRFMTVPVYTAPPQPPHVEVGGNVGATVDVEVKVEPVVIEVPLGASVFGVGVSIDPRVLPLDRLQNAGFIEVELSGPAGALAEFRGKLSATLSSRGMQVDGWSTVETSARIVRAKFTIWPPGTRPPGR